MVISHWRRTKVWVCIQSLIQFEVQLIGRYVRRKYTWQRLNRTFTPSWNWGLMGWHQTCTSSASRADLGGCMGCLRAICRLCHGLVRVMTTKLWIGSMRVLGTCAKSSWLGSKLMGKIGPSWNTQYTFTKQETRSSIMINSKYHASNKEGGCHDSSQPERPSMPQEVGNIEHLFIRCEFIKSWWLVWSW